MTDTDQEHSAPSSSPPSRRRKAPSAKRTPPPRRSRSAYAPVAGGGNGEDPITTLIRQNQELLARIDRLESGQMRTVPMQEPPKVLAREADPEELTPFVAEIRQQTKPTPQDFVRKDKLYNFPAKLYAKPDGMVVSLQGDPQNRAYYRDKGYFELDAQQERLWYGGERQKVVAIQRQKAEIINSMREQVLRDPNLKASISLETEMAWDHMSVAELERFHAEMMGIPDQHGKPRRKLRPPQRLIDAENRKAEAEADRLMRGVEVTPPAAIVAEFEAEQEQAASARRRGARDIEVTPRTARSFA